MAWLAAVTIALLLFAALFAIAAFRLDDSERAAEAAKLAHISWIVMWLLVILFVILAVVAAIAGAFSDLIEALRL